MKPLGNARNKLPVQSQRAIDVQYQVTNLVLVETRNRDANHSQVNFPWSTFPRAFVGWLYHGSGDVEVAIESLELMDKRFVEVARMRDLPPGTVTIAVHGRDRVALTNVDGHVYGLATACTHAGASLAKGRLDGFLLECPVHCSQFDVRSGRPQN